MSSSDKTTFPGIKKLIWNISMGPEGIWNEELEAFIAPQGSPLFPKVTSLQLRNSGNCPDLARSILRHYGPKVRHLSLLNSLEHCLDTSSQALLLLTLCLSRLEFNLGDNPAWELILKKYSTTLTHLKLTGVRNINPDEKTHDLKRLIIPILWNLVDFRISRAPHYLSRVPCRHPETGVPELELKFVTGTSNGIELNYAQQFPSLLRLEVDDEGIDSWETCLPFLYGSFLSQGQGPCNSVRILSFPIPPKAWKPWRLEVCQDCATPQIRTSDILPGREVKTEYLSRVVTTFPNIKNMTRYKYLWREEKVEMERRTKMREWLQIGEEMGLLTGSRQDFKC